MFKRSRRISRADFSRQGFLQGPRSSSAHFSIVIPRTDGGYAVVISKKTVRLSVKRHLLKRRVLAALKTLPHLPAALVVYPKAGALALSPAELREELRTLVGQSSAAR